jgi:hypothetical protein
MAVSTSSDLILDASGDVEKQSNYELFKVGIPGNLQLIEGLTSASPKNENLLSTLNKGYAGLAFGVNETQMAEEEWAELKSEEGKRQALLNYSKAVNFGERYLKENDINFRELASLVNEPQVILHTLDQELKTEKRDLEVVLFTAQSLAGLINLQKDNMLLVSQLPVAKALFDWVCSKNPQINYGTCDIFYGAYEAGRPTMLGGNPQKGKDIFLKAISKHPHNWLIRTSYIQFYLIPQNDEEGFNEQMEFLKGINEKFQKQFVYDSTDKGNPEWMMEEKLRLYQTISMKRYELLNRFQKQFF